MRCIKSGWAVNSEPIGLLLAAGAGRRFDPSGQRDKLLEAITIGGRSAPVLRHSAAHLRQALASVVVVVAEPEHGRVAALGNEEVEILCCPGADAGLGSVLAWSVARLPPGPILVALGDMPWLRPTTVRAVAAAISADRAVAACHGGRRGHPVGFPAAWRARLTDLQGARGAADLLARDAPLLVECDDPGVIADLDTVADLAAARFGTGV